MVLFLGGGAFAHPPSSIVLSFDYDTQILNITVPHGVSNPQGDHYIDFLTVSLNGKEIITQQFFSQAEGREQVALYKIVDAKKGDTIQVYARCNKFGDKKEALILE